MKLCAEDFIFLLYWPKGESPTRGWMRKTPYGVTVVHRPTGLLVSEHGTRSEWQNKSVALEKLVKLIEENNMASFEQYAKDKGVDISPNVLEILAHFQQYLVVTYFTDQVGYQQAHPHENTRIELDWSAILPEFKFAAYDKNGEAWVFTHEPYVLPGTNYWSCKTNCRALRVDHLTSYHPGDQSWENSLVSRHDYAY